MGPLNLHVGPWPLCQASAQQWSQLPAPRGVSTLTPAPLALSLPSHCRFFPHSLPVSPWAPQSFPERLASPCRCLPGDLRLCPGSCWSLFTVCSLFRLIFLFLGLLRHLLLPLSVCLRLFPILCPPVLFLPISPPPHLYLWGSVDASCTPFSLPCSHSPSPGALRLPISARASLQLSPGPRWTH